MSTLSGLISAGGGGGALPQIALTQSQTWVPPQDGNVCIHVIGAGASGRASDASANANGGGAGGYCKKNSLAVTTSGSYTVVVGVGGAPQTTTPSSASYHNAGGASTVAGTGLSATLTANGGAGYDGRGASYQLLGGSASGGDVNNTGGSGNAGGGGAVGVYGAGAVGNAPAYYYRGGTTDAYGDVSLSGFGHIAGGKGGNGKTFYGNHDRRASENQIESGGFLCGGGSVYARLAQSGLATIYAGDGGIGGGGGGLRTNGTSGQWVTGRGGDGIVLIQYLPS